MEVEYGTSRVTVEHGKSSVLMVSAPDGDNSEEELDKIVAKGELNEEELGVTMGVSGLADEPENGLNESEVKEIVVVEQVSATEIELESAVAEAVIVSYR